MIPKTGQIPFRFPEPALTFDDMAITPATRGVISAVRRPEHWPYFAFCLIGAANSGLTTCALAWVRERGGVFLDHTTLDQIDLAKLETSQNAFVALDRVDIIDNEKSILWLFSAVERTRGRLFLTARSAPEQWSIASPDLRSRFKAMPVGDLGLPDEDMMRARIRRACARAYLKLPSIVEDYLVTRLGLDYSALEDAITRLDGAAGQGKQLTVPMVKNTLGLDDDNYDLFAGER